jgi:hypothetical protein
MIDLDVTALIPRLSINSSIESETMFGIARFVDSIGLLEETPLRGEEQIIFEIADSKTINESGGIGEGVVEEPYRFTGFIYKIDNVETNEVNDVIVYDVHFISYQSFKAGMFEIIKAFTDVKVSDIVTNLFNSYYLNDAETSFIDSTELTKLILEETDGLIRCTIPKMRPEEAMTFLSKRSFSTRSPSCLFRFFENSRGYHYVTDEELFRLAESDETRKFKFTYNDSIPKTTDFFEEQLNNLEVLNNTIRVNSLNDIYNGAYRNKVLEIDILSKELNLLDGERNQYDYLSRRNNYFDVRSFQRLKDRHTTNFIRTIHRGSEDVQKEWLVIQNYSKTEQSGDNSMQAETFYPEIISNRTAYVKHIESIVIEATGPGRFDITAGDVIELNIKKFQFADGEHLEDYEQNKHLSGRYIVKSISHIMDKEEMFNSYELIKKDWAEVEDLRMFRGGR